MGFNFRKSIKIGPARVNLSKSGVGFSVGAGGLRYTKSPKRKKKNKSSGSGVLGKVIGYALAFLALLGLVVSYWQWALAILAVVIACVIGYRVYIKKKAHADETAEHVTEDDNNPVP